MRVRRGPPPPPPPTAQPLPSYRGAEGLGGRQAEILARLRRQSERAAGRPAGRDARRRTGIADASLVTPFEEAMDEAYDRLLGRQGRRQRDEPDAHGEEPAAHADADPEPGERPTPMVFRPSRWRV